VGRLEGGIGAISGEGAEEELRLPLWWRPRRIASRGVDALEGGRLRFGALYAPTLAQCVLGGPALVIEGRIDAIWRLRIRGVVYRLRGSAALLNLRSDSTPATLQRFLNPWARTRSHRTESGFMVGRQSGRSGSVLGSSRDGCAQGAGRQRTLSTLGHGGGQRTAGSVAQQTGSRGRGQTQ
jgi:hypothetical protein